MWAVFAQVTWNMSDSWRLILGGRYTDEQKEATKTQVHFGSNNVAIPATDPSGTVPNVLWALNPLFGAFNIEPYDTIEGDRDESEFNPLATLQWDATDDIMVYATYVEGFKAGGFDIRSNGHPDPQ
jgi:outer membrane receptor protein involved in Fe transport